MDPEPRGCHPVRAPGRCLMRGWWLGAALVERPPREALTSGTLLRRWRWEVQGLVPDGFDHRVRRMPSDDGSRAVPALQPRGHRPSDRAAADHPRAPGSLAAVSDGLTLRARGRHLGWETRPRAMQVAFHERVLWAPLRSMRGLEPVEKAQPDGTVMWWSRGRLAESGQMRPVMAVRRSAGGTLIETRCRPWRTWPSPSRSTRSTRRRLLSLRDRRAAVRMSRRRL